MNKNMKTRNFFLLILLLCFVQGYAKQTPKCENVILIGTDGLTPEILRNNPGRYKNIEALMAEGCWTLEARSVLPSSSAINWKTMISGAGSEMHGFTDWGTKTPEVKPIYTNRWGTFPTIFGVMREQHPNAETGVIYSWSGIKYIYENGAVNYNMPCKEGDDKEVMEKAVKYIQEKTPNLLFVYFSNPDEAGHQYGWCSKEYYAACDTIDAYIGAVVKAIRGTYNMNKTAIVLSSDHGGINKGHGGKTMVEMQTPLIIVGGKLPANHQMKFPVMRYDTAVSIADLLRLKVPDVWRGKSVFRND
jgi:predicted AlkP superfamily pyrophosphatase or phosphodiesterase